MDSLFALLGVFGVVVLGVLWLIVHCAFAAGVMKHATARQPELVGPLLWTLATLLGGVFVAVAYWIVNVSSLRPPAAGTRHS